MKYLLLTVFLLFSCFVCIIRAEDEEPHLIPSPNLTQDQQIEELEKMSDVLNQKIETTELPSIPASNLTQEEQVEELKEMSDGSFFKNELNKKLTVSSSGGGIGTPDAVQSPDAANITKEESSKILSEEITRRLDNEPH